MTEKKIWGMRLLSGEDILFEEGNISPLFVAVENPMLMVPLDSGNIKLFPYLVHLGPKFVIERDAIVTVSDTVQSELANFYRQVLNPSTIVAPPSKKIILPS